MSSPEPMPPRLVLRFPRPAVVWGVSAGALSLIGWYKAINLLLLLGYFLLALIAVNALLAYQMVRRVTGARRPGGPAGFPGEPIPHAVAVENVSDRPATVLVADPTAGQPARWLLAPFPAGGRDVLRTEFRFPRRGRYPVGPLAIESEYPLGLVRWSAVIEPTGEHLVLPTVGHVDVDVLRRWLGRAAGGESRTRRPARRPTPGLGDIRGLRPYRPGDSPRDVHWKTTARRGQLVVREYDQTDPLNLVVVLDPWSPTHTPTGQAADRLEWALGLAASVGWAWATADEPGDLTLVIPGDPAYTRTGHASTRFVRDAFAPIAAIVGGPDVPAVPASAVRASAVRTARLVVSTRPDSPVLAGLRRSGVPAAGTDPTVPPRWYVSTAAAGG